jgi:hypothetical protein
MKRYASVLTIFGLLLCSAGGASAQNAIAPSFKVHNGGFTAEEGGFVISASGGGSLASLEEIEPGQYVLTGEYKTDNMAALAKFATDVQSADGKTALSAYEFTSASPEWSPLVLYANIETKGKVLLRFGNWQKTNGAESKVHVRNLAIKPQEWTDGMNLLIDGDLKSATMDYLPPNWFWKAGKSKDIVPGVSYSVMQDAVTAKNTIHLVVPMTEDEVLLHGRSFNLPKSGDLELTFKARASKPCSIIPRIVQSWTAQYTQTHAKLGTEWENYSVKYSVVPDPKRKFFFIRFDVLPKQEATIDICEIKLIYRAAAAAQPK